MLDLGTGVFTCFTPGYYSVSFSASGNAGPDHVTDQFLFLFKNGVKLPESEWYNGAADGAVNGSIGGTGSRILVSKLLGSFA